MWRSRWLPKVLTSLLVVVAAPAAAGDGVQVTYLANEGFLLEAGETKVLVDALFGDGLKGYPVVSADLRGELEAGRGRFAGIDLVLATHYHRDHFDAAAVARFLRANPQAVFVSTRQAVAALDAELGERAGLTIEPRLPEEGETASLSFDGIELAVLNLHHGRDLQPPVENLGFVITLGGWRLLHIGDTEATAPDFRPLDLPAMDLDLALLPGWFLAEPRWQPVTRELIDADHLVAMHLAEAGAPASWFGSAGSLEGRKREIRTAFPGVWIPSAELDSKRFGGGAPE